MKGHRLRDAIGVVLIAGFLLAIGVLVWQAIPQGNEQLVTYMLGQLSGFAAAVVAFHYSSNVNAQRGSENTGKAFEAITAAANAGTMSATAGPVPVTVQNKPDDPVPVESQ
jgi:hypothetical protein